MSKETNYTEEVFDNVFQTREKLEYKSDIENMGRRDKIIVKQIERYT